MGTRSEGTLAVIWTLFIRLAVIAGVAYFLYRVRSVLIAVLLAIMLAYVMQPAVEFLCRSRLRKMGRYRARLVATILVFLVFIAISVLGVRMFWAPFGTELTKLGQNFDSYVEEAKKAISGIWAWYQALPPDAKEFLRRQDYARITSWLTKFVNGIITGTLTWATHIADIVLIPVLAFYFVLDSRSLKRELLGLVPRRRLREALMLTRNTAEILQSYVIGQLILCLIAGLLTAVALSWARMDYVLVLSVFAGITRAIPILGPLISGIPIVLLAAATRSVETAVFLLAFVIAMHFVESKFIMPKLIGDRMRLHPAVVIIVLLIGAEFFGLLGMFLAAPAAAVIRELVRFYVIRPRLRRESTVTSAARDLTGAGLRSGGL